MRHAPALVLAAFVWLLVPATPARGAFIPWKYNWSRNPSIIYSDTSHTTYITLTDEQLRSAAGSSDIVATNIRTFSDADPAHPAPFTHSDYTLTLYLLDVNSNKSGTLQFSGFLDGAVSSLSSNFQNTFNAPQSQILDLGDNQYTVKITSFTPPGPPGASNAGAISAHASVSVTQIQKTPEPSTLVLLLCGGPVLGYRAWRRRRRASRSAGASRLNDSLE
jgi:hypothetical protein